MIRLVFLLAAGLFAAMLIGGQDRGQVRFGLSASKVAPLAPPAVIAETVQQAAVEAAVATVVNPAPTPIKKISFAPAEPVMVPQAAAIKTVKVVAQPTPDAARILFVAAKSVNVREGPGKDFGVVSRLVRGEAVLVVSSGEGPDGWSLIRIEGDGVEGYIASRLLAE